MSNTTNPGERGRFSAPRKTATVLRLLRGEDLELVSRELGVTAATLSGWRDDFLTGGQAALKSRPADDRDDEIARLRGQGRRADHGQRTADSTLPGRWPFRPEETEAVGQTVSPSTGQRYGLARVCRIWELPRTTNYFERHQRAVPIEERPEPKRRGPLGPCSDEELVGHIRRILTESPFHGEGYRKVWARLRYQGIRTSKERVRRLMREHGLQGPPRGTPLPSSPR
jgi:hypothetical protein